MTTGGIDASLDPPGGISGTVTGFGGVGLFRMSRSQFWTLTALAGWATTNASGAYTITGLSAGAYKVEFRSNDSLYLGEWYDNKPDFASATEVVVTAGNTTDGINAVLTREGIIAGTVIGVGGIGLSDVWVEACPSDGSPCSSESTRASGGYGIMGLAAGAYKVRFRSVSGYHGEWYDDKPDFASATEVVVSAGSATRGIDAALIMNAAPVASGQAISTPVDTAQAITLTATDTDGDPLTYLVVTGPAHGTISGTAPDLTYHPAAGYNGLDSFTFTASDGVADSNVATVGITVGPVSYVLWTRSDSGQGALWHVNPATGAVLGGVYLGQASGIGSPWQATSYAHVSAAEGYVLWTRSDTGQAALWKVIPVSGAVIVGVYVNGGQGIGKPWQATSYAHASDTSGEVLWTRGDSGQAALWTIDPGTGAVIGGVYLNRRAGIGAPWQAASYTQVNAEEGFVLWTRGDYGLAALWKVNPVTGAVASGLYVNGGQGIGRPWQATSYAHASDSSGEVLWTRSDNGEAALWTVIPGTGAVVGGFYLGPASGIGAPWQATSHVAGGSGGTTSAGDGRADGAGETMESEPGVASRPSERGRNVLSEGAGILGRQCALVKRQHAKLGEYRLDPLQDSGGVRGRNLRIRVPGRRPSRSVRSRTFRPGRQPARARRKGPGRSGTSSRAPLTGEHRSGEAQNHSSANVSASESVTIPAEILPWRSRRRPPRRCSRARWRAACSGPRASASINPKCGTANSPSSVSSRHSKPAGAARCSRTSTSTPRLHDISLFHSQGNLHQHLYLSKTALLVRHDLVIQLLLVAGGPARTPSSLA